MTNNISPVMAALKGRCPRCGKGKLFRGVMTIVDGCAACKLSLKTQDSGDGPVFFGLIIAGFLSIGFEGYIELRYAPEWWVHALVFIPFTLLLVFVTMRFFKAWLIALQFKHRPDTFID